MNHALDNVHVQEQLNDDSTVGGVDPVMNELMLPIYSMDTSIKIISQYKNVW